MMGGEKQSASRPGLNQYSSNENDDNEMSFDSQLEIFNLQEEEAQMRKKLFFQSIRTKNWKFIAINTLFGLILCIYFGYNYFYHLQSMSALREIKDYTPIFFQRYENLMLGFAFMRERIINNNSLEAYVNKRHEDLSPENIDVFYKERSLMVEMQLMQLKN